MGLNVFKTTLMIGVAAAGVSVAAPAMAQSSENAANSTDIIVTARRVEERLQDVPISITVFNQDDITKRNIAVATDLAAYTPSLSVNQRFGPEKSNFNIRGFNQDLSTAPTVGVYFAEVVGVRAQGGTTSGNTVGAGAFSDLENVQVLKGPQGTLFGRNTTGGAVLLTPKKPTGNLEGYVEGSYGNYDQVKVSGAINLPLSDTFKVRLSAERYKRDGYVNNRSGIGPADFNDVNYKYARLSIVANLTPDLENYTIFHYSQSNTNGYASKITGCASPTSPEQPLLTDRTALGYSATRHLQAASCEIQFARQNARGDGFYDVETSNPNPFIDIVQWQVINTTTWDVSDSIRVKNIMSYGEFRERANFDLGSSNFEVPLVDQEAFPIFGDGFDLTRVSPFLTTSGGQPGGFPLFATAGTPYQRIVLDTAGPGRYNSQQSTFTEELQVQFESADGRLNGVVGGYLEFSRPLGRSQGRTGIFLDCVRAQNLECTNPLFFGSVSESSTELNFDNHGIFGQGTFAITDQLSVTAGARYTFDKITGNTNGTRASLSSLGRPGAFPDPLTGVIISRRCTDSFRHGGVAVTVDRSVCLTNLTNKSNKPTWNLGLDFKPTPDMLVYAKYSRGYRQGGINFTNPGVELWGPEKLDSYEIGAKATFRGAVSGYFNISGFYNNLQDAQFFAGLVSSPQGAASGVAGGAAIVNAGKSRIMGIEVDAGATFFDSLRFSLGYAYLDTEVKSVEDPASLEFDPITGDFTGVINGSQALGQLLVGTPFGSITPRVSPGSRFTDTPKHKLTATATYTLPLDESIGDISFGATFTHTSSVIYNGSVPASVNGIPLGIAPSTDLLNLNIDWKGVAGSPIDVSLFATNVTKEKFHLAETGAWSTAGIAEVVPNQPRFYGVRVRFNFGQ